MYQTTIRLAGGGYEAVVTLSGTAERPNGGQLEVAKESVLRWFEELFGRPAETVGVVCCPVESGNIPS